MWRTPSPNCFFSSDGSDALQCYMHLTRRAIPGLSIYFKGVVHMARAEQHSAYGGVRGRQHAYGVGQCAGRCGDGVVPGVGARHVIVGLVFKVAKDRLVAREQLALGFIWDSVTLESRKLESYLALLSEYAGLPTLDLRQMQSMAGKLHRMLMTLPPGSACLAASLFELMSGLKHAALASAPHDAPAARGLHVGALRGLHGGITRMQCSLPDRARSVDRGL